MTIISEPITDLAGVGDATEIVFTVDVMRPDSDGVGIITTKRVPVYPVDGVLTTPPLDPGPARVKLGPRTYSIVIPDSPTPIKLWPLLESTVEYTPPVVGAAQAAATAAAGSATAAAGSATAAATSATAAAGSAASVAGIADTVTTGRLSAAALDATYVRGGRVAAQQAPGIAATTPVAHPSPPTTANAGPGGASPIASSVLIPHNSTKVSRLGGGAWKTENQFGTDYLVNGVNALWTPPPYVIEFDYYGSDLAVLYRAKTSGKYWEWIDGQPLTSAPVAHGYTGGSLYRRRITFAAPGLHRIRFHSVINADFGGLEIGPADSVTPVVQTAAPSILWYGQSYVEGAAGIDGLDTFATLASRYLGMTAILDGQGGTGFLNNGANGNKSEYCSTGRRDGAIAAAPDYLVLVGSGNDDGFTGAAIESAADTLIGQLQTALPATQIIVISPPAIGTTPPAGRAANSAALAAAAAAHNVPFIDMLTDPWVTGTGRSGAPMGNGSADVFLASDGVHPTAAGHAYLGRRVGQAIQAVIDGL